MLVACGGGKIQPIVAFTTKLKADNTERKVELKPAKSSVNWHNSSSWINEQPDNFAVNLPENISFNASRGFYDFISAPVIYKGDYVTLDKNAQIQSVAMDGKQVNWSNNLSRNDDHRVMGGGLYIKNDKLYVTYGSRDLVVIDPKDGKELWRFELPDISRAQPAMRNNTLYVSTISNQLCALNTDLGVLTWVNDGIPEALTYGNNIAPVVIGNNILVGYSSGELALLDANDGKEVWKLNFANNLVEDRSDYVPYSFDTQPIIAGDYVFIANASGLVVKVRISDGQIMWDKKMQDVLTMNKAGNTLFITNNARQIAAVNAGNGDVIWVKDLYEGKSKKPLIFSVPIIVEGKLLVTSSDGKLHIISPSNGEIIKTIEVAKHARHLVVGRDISLFTKDRFYNLVSKKK